MKYKLLCFAVLTVFVGFQAMAEDPGPKVVNSTGGTLQFGTVFVDFSLGEVAVATLSYSGGTITEGFLQPVQKVIVTSVEGMDKLEGISIFPNPVGQTLSYASSEVVEKMVIYSVEGVLVASFPSPLQVLDVSFLNPGVYRIEVETKGKRIFSNISIIKQ